MYNIQRMEMFDFTDPTFLVFFFGMIAIVAAIIIFIITYSVSKGKAGKNKKEIEAERNSLRIYVINVKDNEVLSFKRSDLRNKTVMSLTDFYNEFHPNDIEKVKAWILSICVDEKSAETYLEADAMIEKQKVPAFSLLKLVKYNREQSLIHIENHILRYVTPTNIVARKKRGVPTGVLKRSVMANIIAKEKSIYGFTFAIRFFYKKQNALTEDKVERFMVMSLKNEIYPYVSDKKSPRQIVEVSQTETLLFDLQITNKEDAMRLASSIAQNFKRIMSLNGYGDKLGFAIGVMENAQYYQQFDIIVQHAEEACIAAQQSNQDVMMYEKTTSPELDLAQYRDNIERLMKPSTLRYSFRPIVDITNTTVLGYFDYIKAYNSPFNSFIEMARYAEKIQENRNLLGVVARNVIPKFATGRPNAKCRLFFELSLLDAMNAIEILPQIPESNNVKIVLEFKEQEVNENASDVTTLNALFVKLHEAGYEIALTADDKDLLLDPSIYYNFDYFIAGANMIGEIKKNNRVRLSIHTLIEQLLKYKKPIIATDLEGWQAVELIVKSGITLLSAECISASNDMLLPVDRKTMDKLGKLYETYR